MLVDSMQWTFSGSLDSVRIKAGDISGYVSRAEPAAGAAGLREFDVRVNGKTMLRRFDIFAAAGGKLKAVDRSFEATSRDGAILIDFHPLKGGALVSALAIAPAT